MSGSTRSLLAVAALGVGLAAICAATPPSTAAEESPGPTKLLTIRDPRILESSGLAASRTLPDVLWTVNDSGGEPEVYGVGPDGRTALTLRLDGATNRDWEAVSVGPRPDGGSWLWVGDIGDNNSVWTTIRIYRVAEPTAAEDQSVAWTAYDLRYPDGPRDAETLLVDPSSGRLYVVSKRVQGAAVYEAPAQLRAGQVNVLTRVASAGPLMTDGSFAPDGRVALRGYLDATVAPGIGKKATRLALPLQPQGESLTWDLDGSAVLVGSEGERSAVWRVPVPTVVESKSPSAKPVPTGTDATVAAASSPALEESSGWSIAWVGAAGLVLGGGLAWVAAVRRNRSTSD